jgi:hypothetical protein
MSSSAMSPSSPPRHRRKRFNIHAFLTTLEFTVFRIVVTASFLYCLYRVFMHEIGR